MSPRINAITLLVIALAGCPAKRRRTPDDTIVLLIEAAITTLDPRYTTTNLETKVSRLIAPGLTTVDTPTGEPELMLAAAIDRVDPLTIDVTLRDATFSDGNPVRAEDVVRSYQTVMDDNCGSLYQKGFLDRFVKIEALDAKHVRFYLHAPLAMFMNDVDFGVISFHGVPPGTCRPPKLVGAGPYKLAELTAREARIDANPRFFGTTPKTPHVVVRTVRDASARILMLVGGSADLVQNAIRGDLIEDVIKRPRVRVETGPSVLLTYMLLNNEDPVLKDKRVRQALALALDRRAIIDAKYAGRAVLATGLLPPSHWAYNGNVAHWEHDIARAKALLDEAGLKPDPRGIRLHLVYKTSADAFRVAIARVIAAQLADVGIDVEVRSFEFGTFFADIKNGNYQIATMQSPEITEPDFYRWFFHSSNMPGTKNSESSNRWRYRNPEIDRLTDAGRTELDPAKRKQIYGDAQRIIAEDVPIIPLWHEDNVALSNVDLKGYKIVPNARYIGLIGASKSP
ncbi:MAG TPA: ABC transporter substrate-binding protein [Kofleriaceae bacterium]|jgi:peptide/nickel transport system substrate-binding protein|nr:ABC transporter substrate-binding protein [Kofleriaceae bacterium]